MIKRIVITTAIGASVLLTPLALILGIIYLGTHHEWVVFLMMGLAGLFFSYVIGLLTVETWFKSKWKL